MQCKIQDKIKNQLRFYFVLICFILNETETTVPLHGKGASFPYEVYKSWIPAYKAHRQTQVSLEMSYEAVGSSNGKTAIKDKIVEYAGSDTLLSADEHINYPDLVTIPTMAGGVVLAYNIPGLNQQLHLTRDQIVGIYNGTHRYWNESTFHMNNPNSTMPNEEIIVIARADKSGTTNIFTGALSAFSRAWASSYGTFSKGLNTDTNQPYNWGRNIIKYYGERNRGVSGLLISFRYSIAYLSVADALESDLLHAKIENKVGFYAHVSSESIQSAMDYASRFSTNLTFDLLDIQSELAYPIAGFTYLIFYKREMGDCDSAKELVHYIYWFMTSNDQIRVCEEKGFAPLSETMVTRITESVLKVITCKGNNVWDMVQQDLHTPQVTDNGWIVPVVVSLVILFLAIFTLCTYIVYQKMKLMKMLNRNDWNIPIEDILFVYDGRGETSQKSKLSGLKSFKSCSSFQDLPDANILGKILQWPGKWKGYNVGLRLMEINKLGHFTLDMKRCLIWMRETILHTNVVRFYGLTELDKQHYVIGEYCIKGPMTDILQDNKFNLSDDFKYCLANDIAHGMQFLHNQGITHGNLKSSCCLIDNRWIVKVGDWEYLKLLSVATVKENYTSYLRNMTLNSYGHHMASFEDYWVAPEIIKSEFTLSPSQYTDVYSYAIILQEIFTREDPYYEHADYMSPKEVISAVVNNNLRPEVSSDIPVTVRQVMEIAWSEDPLCRPNFDQILKMFRRSRAKGKSVLDAMMESMEEYTQHLEQRINEQTQELLISKENMECVMSSLIPTPLASMVCNGEAIEAKIHKALGIIVVDIVDLDKLVNDLSPSEAFAYLNHLNTELGLLSKQYSAYRESTSGSFILIKGLGEKRENENEVCFEMAHLCLDIISKTTSMKIPGLSESNLKVKLGVDIGHGISGIIGSTVPKFEVLGSVFDNAHALARASLASKIHVSGGLGKKLKMYDEFKLEEAGILSQSQVSLEMSYEAVGSSNGKTAIKDKIVEYAGSDTLLSADEHINYPDLVTIPTMAGGVVLAYNIPSLNQQLHLTRDQIVGIYNGTHRYWNESTFHMNNPNSTMPNEEIIVIARADKSGTTNIFTGALSAFSRAWASSYGTFSKGLNTDTNQPYNWGRNIIKYYGERNRGVSGLLISFRYSIAYLSVADALESDLLHAKIENKVGFYAHVSSESIQSAMDYASRFSTNLTFDLLDIQSELAYPIAGFTYLIFYKREMGDCDSAKELVHYIYWFMTSNDQIRVCEEKGFAPLSETMVTRITESVLKVITCKGNNVWDMVQQDLHTPQVTDNGWIVPVVVSLVILFLAIFTLCTYIVYQKMKLMKMLNRNDWNIPIEDILFVYDGRGETSQKSKLSGLKSFKSCSSFQDLPDANILGKILQWPGKWKGYNVGLRLMEINKLGHFTLDMKRCLIWMRETILHTNVVRFYGLTELDKQHYVIGEYCIKGPMTDILQDNKFNLSDDFKYCLANDIAHGMQFLHNQGITHGNLKSSCCLIDNRWIVKVGDWEYLKLLSVATVKENYTSYLRNMTLNSYGHHMASFEDYWVAPEIIKSEFTLSPSQYTDVYSYAIILQEIFTREDPYYEHADYMSPKEVISAVVNNNLRPEVSSDIPVTVRQVMEIAWSEDPLCRPNFDQILKMFRRSRAKGKSVLDAMMESMEEYTQHLEQRINEQTQELLISKENMECVMSSLIPTPLASMVCNGEAIEAKIHKALGIIVVDIVDLDKLVNDLSPSEAFAYLNHLNTELGLLSKQYSAYRESTSGSFILIKGLGEKRENENEVCFEMAHLCLDIISKTTSMKIPGLSESNLKVKLGVDIGHGISGIIGSTVPKFEVLGSVFDNAHALARASLASKIHVSGGLGKKLKMYDEFKLEEAGILSFQGKTMETFWLIGRSSVMFEVASSEMSNDSGFSGEKTKDGILKTVACQTINENSSIEIQDLEQEKNETTKHVQITKNQQNTNTADTSSPQPRNSKSISGRKSPKRLFESRKIHPLTFEDIEL
ncbi:hypothetical protein KUTeg_019072 [Tegillarca granosa]|uniref:guanylate cyclase n=1 Tax=Tegillarca granosa TaxID=220873 RepID=A0ABQ9EBF4_TEGGR|nr:hypothetical protein KUTeg_019072 [Tegillarca granosa]